MDRTGSDPESGPVDLTGPDPLADPVGEIHDLVQYDPLDPGSNWIPPTKLAYTYGILALGRLTGSVQWTPYTDPVL